ncbi:flagellar hook-associated protein FlgL [Paenibacillus sp. DXFW5]|uniref:Flagellar hook-associated protein FlgL n=1 Tax=Paenibacillus rhizolycopersici TaxID=2780073 RepID=A0ABS2HBM9_9BACL|nr:flagellar hook-associated protein FlgL [Paenibacillus rhizolycopersici]MBM6997275.1 flagellar hook-associated protein FlgL [Paenibacillus rhizolycopersici]
MALRVTSNMMSNQVLRNLNRNLNKMSEQQNQLSTGRKINQPSDDPVGVTYALRYRSELAANDQYSRNVNTALGWLDTTDTVMSQTEDVLNRLKELTTQASNGTNPQSALDSIASELVELKKQLGDLGNTQINGKYIFNGQTYNLKPYDSNNPASFASAETDPDPVEYTVGQGVTFQINTSGNDFFGEKDGADNVFNIIDKLLIAMQSSQFGDISAEITNIDSRLNKMVSVHSETGARTNRVELMQARLSNEDLKLTELQSKTEDADIAELMIQSNVSSNIYQASLSAGAKIITPTLVDFIK